MISENANYARTKLWNAINCYASLVPETKEYARAKAYAAVVQEMDFLCMVAGAEMSGTLENGVMKDASGVWPNWVYEAHEAIKHQNENIPWLPDLLKILGWQGGTVHQAMQAVRRCVDKVDEIEKRPNICPACRRQQPRGDSHAS